MGEKLDALKKFVIDNCKSEQFIHNPWFVERHLTIVEKLVEEICDMCPEADREICRILVWFHDLGKSIDFENEKIKTKTEGVKIMKNNAITMIDLGKYTKTLGENLRSDHVHFQNRVIKKQGSYLAERLLSFYNKSI